MLQAESAAIVKRSIALEREGERERECALSKGKSRLQNNKSMSLNWQITVGSSR